MSKPTNLGPCCCCGLSKGAGPVRTLICLAKKAPGEVQGWGCLQCGLPQQGAVAVVCDKCADKLEAYVTETGKPLEESLADGPLKFFCGTDRRERLPIALLLDRPAHKHDMARHPEEWAEEHMQNDAASS